jgi:hypothetical protein
VQKGTRLSSVPFSTRNGRHVNTSELRSVTCFQHSEAVDFCRKKSVVAFMRDISVPLPAFFADFLNLQKEYVAGVVSGELSETLKSFSILSSDYPLQMY